METESIDAVRSDMPDYNVIQKLCDELGVSISELMDAEENEPDSIRTYDDEQILDLIMCSGVLLGLSIGINITGVIITVRGIVKQQQ